MLHVEVTIRKYILCGLVENEAERTHIDAHARLVTHVNKLDIAILPNAELQSLRCIVHFCRNDWIWKFQIERLKDFQQGNALVESL